MTRTSKTHDQVVPLNHNCDARNGCLTNVCDQVCCNYPAALGEAVEVVCDRDGGRANDGNFEVDAEDSKKKPEESHVSEGKGSTRL